MRSTQGQPAPPYLGVVELLAPHIATRSVIEGLVGHPGAVVGEPDPVVRPHVRRREVDVLHT